MENFRNNDSFVINMPEYWGLVTGDSTLTNKSMQKLPITKDLLDPEGTFLPMWNKIFVIACVVAVLSDPLFLYIPILKDDTKCLGFDAQLKKVSLVSRSVTDLFYIVDIILQICSRLTAKTFAASWISITEETFPLKGEKSVKDALALAKRISLSYILIDILAVLPLPQVVILTFFSKVRASKPSITRIFLNFLVLFQYVPRILRIYSSGKAPSIESGIGLWIKGVFNFFPFFLAGHVLGAIWYFFAIQRETACWVNACRGESGCEPSTFICNNNVFRNVTHLNSLCPKNPPDATVFDFGIFLDALQSGMLESTDFPQKLLQCFWWGLRNLSSFGQNLEPSPYALENLFTVVISISGMLLFLIYLNANLQTYVELEAKRADNLRFRRKMQIINPEIDLWLHKNGLPKDLKMGIMDNVQQKLEENKDVHVENILSILPLKHKRHIMRLLRLASLRKVSMLKDMDEQVLKAICEHLKPVIYAEDSYIIREGEPLEKMIFITQGIAWTYATNINGGGTSSSSSSGVGCLEKGDFYGEELLNWAFNFASFSELPISTRTVKSQRKLEAFAIRANDLQSVVSKFWWHFSMELPHDNQQMRREHLATSCLQKTWRRYHAGPRGGTGWKKFYTDLVKTA
ncbi:cyclic nucleotide-gated ion channel 1-like [Argentina anserina]|uniref:cyclic nucleotide-gated ion channel 1-like n=1 Tax=Argentina anserina TaxID=57926 RepID=UPI0021765823|nr:cyclic nucleotide-gated ion channel 1-like [Potentilla anserina]